MNLLAAIRHSFKPLCGSGEGDSSDSCSEVELPEDHVGSQEARIALPSLELALRSITDLSGQVADFILQMRREQRALQPLLEVDDLVAAADPVDDAPAMASAEEVEHFFRVMREAPAIMDSSGWQSAASECIKAPRV
jgi:hypothetical protein